MAFFEKAEELELSHARIAAFGSTRRANTAVEEDAQVKLLLDAATPVVTILEKLGSCMLPMYFEQLLRRT